MTKSKNPTSEEGGGLNRRRIHLREISGDPEAPLESVGQDLRAARLRRGDDLATVSKALKIRKDHLEALEEDRFEALPGRTYAVGFVRTYAEYLGLNVAQCVDRFKTEIAGRNGDDTPTVTVIEEDEHRKLPQGWKFILAVVLLILLYGAYHLMTSGDQLLSQQPVSSVPEQIAPKPAVAAATPPAQAPAADSNDIDPLDASAPIPAAPQTTPAPAAQNNAAPAIAPAAPPTAAVPPKGTVYGARNTNARVILRARQAARILVQGPDGTVYARRILQAGDSFQVPNLVGLTLTTTNAGAVQIDVDGTPMGTAGRDQQVTEALSLDPQAIVDRGGRAPG